MSRKPSRIQLDFFFMLLDRLSMCLGRAYFEREENKWKGNKDGCTDFSCLGHEGNWRVNN